MTQKYKEDHKCPNDYTWQKWRYKVKNSSWIIVEDNILKIKCADKATSTTTTTTIITTTALPTTVTVSETELITDLTKPHAFNYVIIAGVLGVLFLVMGGVGTFFLLRKFKCCLKVIPTGDEHEMTPLTSVENPIPLTHFQNKNEHCLPTEEEFEKLIKEDRYKNALPKSKDASLEFVRARAPINRYSIS